MVGYGLSGDGHHITNPDPDGSGARRAMECALSAIDRSRIGYINAHATSTPLGDLSELRALRMAFGNHAENLLINAPKSMLGHTCWSAPAVETVAALLQVGGRRAHPSINIDNMDPGVDLDVCANKPRGLDTGVFLKNSFGFGGINSCALWRSPHALD